jgi:hypothetical protein
MLFNSYQFTFGFLPAVCVAYFVVARFWGARAGAAAQVSAMYRVGGQSVIDPAVTYWWAQWQFLGEFRWSESSALWLLLVGSIAFVLPNTYQVFQGFQPALVERAFEDAASKPRLRWQPDSRWAVCLSLTLLVAVLRIRELSPFISFQF